MEKWIEKASGMIEGVNKTQAVKTVAYVAAAVAVAAFGVDLNLSIGG